jgi:hypothetical protein
MSDIDSLMVKFNNSIALQNLGSSIGVSSSIKAGSSVSKSRNGPTTAGIHGMSFKTTASINSNKTMDPALKGQSLGRSMGG